MNAQVFENENTEVKVNGPAHAHMMHMIIREHAGLCATLKYSHAGLCAALVTYRCIPTRRSFQGRVQASPRCMRALRCRPHNRVNRRDVYAAHMHL